MLTTMTTFGSLFLRRLEGGDLAVVGSSKFFNGCTNQESDLQVHLSCLVMSCRGRGHTCSTTPLHSLHCTTPSLNCCCSIRFSFYLLYHFHSFRQPIRACHGYSNRAHSIKRRQAHERREEAFLNRETAGWQCFVSLDEKLVSRVEMLDRNTKDRYSDYMGISKYYNTHENARRYDMQLIS